MKILLWALLAAVAIQFIPYGHSHTNPKVTGEPPWDSAETRDLFHRACYDCHSNETVWPWYSHVAPVSWMVVNDVEAGRSHLNFSTWNQGPQQRAKDVAQQVLQDNMPPRQYLPMHPAANLTDAERQALAAGAAKSLGPQAPPKEESGFRPAAPKN